jgi:hypothetical protein
MTMPVWESPPFELPREVEARRDPTRDLAALHLLGTDKVVGFVPSRFDKNNLSALLARLT